MPSSQLHAQSLLYVGTCTTLGYRSARLPCFYGRYLQVDEVPQTAPARCTVKCCRIRAAGIGAPMDHASVRVLNVPRHLYSSLRVKVGPSTVWTPCPQILHNARPSGRKPVAPGGGALERNPVTWRGFAGTRSGLRARLRPQRCSCQCHRRLDDLLKGFPESRAVSAAQSPICSAMRVCPISPPGLPYRESSHAGIVWRFAPSPGSPLGSGRPPRTARFHRRRRSSCSASVGVGRGCFPAVPRL